ncbi:uncharacterized protein LOC119740154 isoform X1 [Patiria miniata]|uniref:Apple domain-containing protein n=1 Tax=Patiria miniata TaxID=46514 RepID=A0A914B5R9_PATMI|nr:uncharacterized protein LOC119740154 isoform X1 [Patiria miniata]
MMVALPSASGGSKVFKCDTNLLVSIVACVAVVACASSWQWQEATYAAQEHRALVGHSIGNHSGVTQALCAVLCLREGDAQCRSFNYDKTGRTCQLNGARVEEFPESLVEDFDFSYYGAQLEEPYIDLPEFHTTPSASEWQLVFKGVAGNGVKMYDMWTAATWDETTMGVGGSWRDDSLYGSWNSGDLDIGRVKLSLCDANNGSGAELIFDGTGSDVSSWFSKDRLISNPWQDLISTATNYFSIYGHPKEDRRFFINRRYGSCVGDYGWLVVTESNSHIDCDWDRSSAEYPYPIILYSRTAGNVQWRKVITEGTDTVGRADYLTIHIDVE